MAYIGITSAQDSEQLSPNYIGFQPTFQRPESAFVVDTFTADGTQQVFPLSNPKPVTSRALLVSVAGYTMVPVIDYNLDEYGNLEFVTPPGSGNAITVHHLIFPKNEATTAIRKLDDISNRFDGTNTRFTLTANGVAANILGANVLVISINGVIQEPGEAYILDGDDIIFSEAPPSISSFYGIDVGTTGIGTPGDATVGPSKFLTDNQASTGKVLGVNSSGNLSWVTVNGGVGATDLDGLSDVSLTLPMSGQVLRFNGSNFVNAKINYSDIQGPPTFAAVATSGNYNDLRNKPVYPTDLSGFTDSQGLLFNKDYASLTNLPNIPDSISEFLDVDIANLVFNQVLVWDGNAWINDNLHLTDLGIVDGTAGQVLTTNGHGEFTFTTITGGSGGAPYTLPPATTTALGGVKVDGTTITITNGVISASATSGVTSYNDLTDKPTLFSGDYNDLTDTPTIPSDVSDLTDTTSLLFSGDYNDLINKPTLFDGAYSSLSGKPTLFSGSYNDLTSKPTLFSGSYTDLTNKPTIPAAQVNSDWNSSSGLSQILNKPTLFSGSYNDLTSKPSLAASATTDTTNAANITSGTLPNARLASVPNSALANNKVTLGSTDVSLGSTVTALSGLTSITTDNITVTSGISVNGQPTTYGYVNGSYLFAVNNADQSVGQNGAVNFQTTSASNGSLITKTSNSRVTLKSGNTYKLKAVIGRLSSSSTWAQFRWYDVTNSAYVGAEGFSESVTSNSSGVASTNVPTAYVTPNVDTTYELRQTTVNTITVNAYASMEVTQVNPSIAVQATATGTVSTNYAKYTRTASQSVSANTVVICNVAESSSGTAVSVNTSTGQVTLTGGKTYRLRGTVGTIVGSAADSRVGYGWYNETASAYVGEGAGWSSPSSVNWTTTTTGTAEYVFTPGSTTVVSLRVTYVLNVSSIGGNAADFGAPYGNPWIDIEEIGASFALNALDTMSTTGNVSVGGTLATTGNTSVGGALAVSGVSLLGGYSQVAGYYSELGVKYSGAGTQHGMTLQPTNDNTTAINFLNAAGTNIGSITQTASTVKFVGDGSQLSKVATQTTGSWTVTTGTNTYSITVPASGTYQIWVRGNIPNGIIAYNATAVVTNTNVPVVGTQYAWVYNGGGTPIDFTSIPNQFIGTAGTIVRSNVAPSATTNRFDFGISNTSGSSQTIYWGYVTI